jgi:hypothetical protein
MKPSPPLSKSKFLAGCQCAKRVWLACRAPALATPADDAQQAVFDQGHEVGRRAHALFPGGVLVAEDARRHARAVERTRALLADPEVPAIFEAAFEHAGVRVRVDALERLPRGRFGLREVKSGTSLQHVHLADCAVQQLVLEGAGLRLGSVELVHVDREYVRGEGPIDWTRFFVRREIGELLKPLLRTLPQRLAEMKRVVAGDAVPAVEPSHHCHEPHACEFWDHCTAGKPGDWTFHLPRLGAPQFEALRALGVERIPAIPDHFELARLQRRIRDVLRSGRAYVSPELGAALGPARDGACYLDFETMSPAIPAWPGTRPYQRIPFQWSLHRLGAGGAALHEEFLAEPSRDPRRAFAETLLAALERTPDAPVHVYSGFERSVLGDLAVHASDLAARIGRVMERLVDLLPLVREHVYLAGFRCSFSIKNVAPALLPGFGWDDLPGIAEGGVAAAGFASLVAGRVPALEQERLCAALRAYCARDTLALLEVHQALRALAARG